jgi:ribosome biogenesis protein BMS1
MTDITGPISVRAGKGRFTFIECPNDLNSFMDTAKVVDVVLLLIDASVGFEMETFEFLNVIQNHGFPKVMGVLTHLDKLKDIKRVKEAKKRLRDRFWVEVCEGSKVFFLSGTRNDLYTPKDTLNLGRFLSLVKTRPLTWKTTHAGVLVDRYEDLTNPESIKKDPTIPRHVCFYGYVRGTFLKHEQKVHIPGVGDFETHDIHSSEDPLPAVFTRKSLADKFRGVYGPMSNMGDLFFDKDSVYLNVRDTKKTDSKDIKEQNEILNNLQTGNMDVDFKLRNQELTLLKNSNPINIEKMNQKLKEKEEEEEEDEDFNEEDFEDEDLDEEEEDEDLDKPDEDEDDFYDNEEIFDPSRRRADFGTESTTEEKDEIVYDDDDEDDEDVASYYANIKESDSSSGNLSNKWKDKLEDKTNSVSKSSLFETIYGSEIRPIVEGDINKEDYSIYVHIKEKELKKWDDEQYREKIRNKFVTGDWNKRRSKKAKETEVQVQEEEENFDDYNDDGIMDGMGDEDDQVDGEEEEEEDDLEAIKKKREEKKRQFDDSYDHKDEEDTEEVPTDIKSSKKKGPTTMREIIKNQQIDDPQVKLNRTEFEGMDAKLREKIEGFAPGTYVRIEITDFPPEFGDNVDFHRPIIVGGLLPEETKMGFLSMRVKKHRWFPKILKNKDPLIFSIGWRRFQSIPIYSVQDLNSRDRMIKYTPKYLHCVATIYAPMVPQNTGVVGFQSLSNGVKNFRLSVNGYTLEFDQKISIVKKLKLVGYPNEIKKNTVFVTGMFNSKLEVAKFEGAQLKTVSGLRGQVKKAINGGKDGDFRATFEDKLLKTGKFHHFH